MAHLSHHQRTRFIHSRSFPLFPSFHPYTCSLNRSLTRSKSAGMNLQCLPNSSIPSEIPPLSKSNLSTSLKPHYLLSPGSLTPSVHYFSDSSFLLPPSSLSANIQVTPIFKNISLWLHLAISSFHSANRPFYTISEVTFGCPRIEG